MCAQATFHAGDKILHAGRAAVSPNEQQILHVLSPALSLSLLICLLIFVVFSQSHPPPHDLSLPLILIRLSFAISPHSFRPRSSLSFPQEEPRSYLGYVGFGELKSHFTNSQSASPEESAGYLKQSHHWSGFVRWSDA